MPALTCRQFIEFLDDYIAGEQPDAVRSEFEKHLAICPYCVDYLHTYRETMKLGKAAFANDLDEPVPRSVPEDLVRAVLAATARRTNQSHQQS